MQESTILRATSAFVVPNWGRRENDPTIQTPAPFYHAVCLLLWLFLAPEETPQIPLLPFAEERNLLLEFSVLRIYFV
jgi:hypothetical protein